jgi:hypothetical protein
MDDIQTILSIPCRAVLVATIPEKRLFPKRLNAHSPITLIVTGLYCNYGILAELQFMQDMAAALKHSICSSR